MRIHFLVLCILVYLFADGQDSTQRYVHKGLLRSDATFTPGIFLKSGLSATYLSGNLEYYFSEKASFRGDGYFFLDFLGKEEPFVFNHSVLAGVSWHFTTKNHLDPYIYFQPGLGIVQSNEVNPCPCLMVDSLLTSSISYDPLLSFGGGVNFYFQKIFHIFGEVRFTQGRHQGNFPARSITDLKFSFGLGWNIL